MYRLTTKSSSELISWKFSHIGSFSLQYTLCLSIIITGDNGFTFHLLPLQKDSGFTTKNVAYIFAINVISHYLIQANVIIIKLLLNTIIYKSTFRLPVCSIFLTDYFYLLKCSLLPCMSYKNIKHAILTV